MAALAVFAHFFLDADSYKEQNVIGDQQTIGWLGIWIFFAPIACIILINIFFYVTTLKLINRRNVYGRIQHKLRANFIMFSWMLLIMSIAWLFFVLSLMPYDGLLYAHILVNAIQAPLLLYICVLGQKHVTFLLKKSCCYNEPPSANDWGDEMHYMNCNDYWDEARVKNAPKQTEPTLTQESTCIFPDGIPIVPVIMYRHTTV